MFYSIGWQKSIDLVEQGRVHGLLAAGRTNHGKTILSDEILGVDRTVLIVRKGEQFDKNELLGSLDGLILGAIVDYTYDFHGPLDNYIQQRTLHNDRIVTLNHLSSVKALFVMLNRGSIDAFPENYFVAHYMADSLGITKQLDFYNVESEDHMYMAFSPNRLGRKLKDVFDQGVRKLKSSGELTHIMHKYGIEDEVSSHSHGE